MPRLLTAHPTVDLPPAACISVIARIPVRAAGQLARRDAQEGGGGRAGGAGEGGRGCGGGGGCIGGRLSAGDVGGGEYLGGGGCGTGTGVGVGTAAGGGGDGTARIGGGVGCAVGCTTGRGIGALAGFAVGVLIGTGVCRTAHIYIATSWLSSHVDFGIGAFWVVV